MEKEKLPQKDTKPGVRVFVFGGMGEWGREG